MLPAVLVDCVVIVTVVVAVVVFNCFLSIVVNIVFIYDNRSLSFYDHSGF